MTECSELGFELPGLSGRKIEGNFEGGNVSSDGGLVLLRQVDRWIGLTKSLAKRLPDKRDPDKIEHSLESMLRQRIYGLALGYEDYNDHNWLRKDLLWQTASERTEELASCSRLCRLENRAGRKEAWLMHQILFDQFVGSFESVPSELTLDLDCTDDRVHGLQEGRHFHGYYYDFCFLPLYIFCGERLLVSYLRESNIDSAKHAWAILALVKRYAIGACSGWNHPLAPTENRRGHHSKHPAHSIVVEFQLPTATALLLLLGSVLRVSLQSGADPGTRKTMVASAGCLPMPLLRHHLARFSANLFAINSSRIPPQHKPPSGAKSGLVHARLSGQSVDRFHQWLNACTAVSTIFWRDCSLRSF